MGLFGGETVALDGAKFKAVNSSANYLDEANLKAKLEIAEAEAKVSTDLAQLNENDESEAQVPETAALSKSELESKILWWQQHQGRLQAEPRLLESSGARILAKTDGDSVQLADRKHKKGVVGYNVQATVDARNHLLVDIDAVTDKNDLGQLSRMAKQARAELEEICPDSNSGLVQGDTAENDGAPEDGAPEKERLNVLADAGYHEANQLEACEQNEIVAFVPAPGRPTGRSKNGVQVFPKAEFTYDDQRDV